MPWMQRVVGESDDMARKRRHIHDGEEGAQLLRSGRMPLRRPFTACTGRIRMAVRGRSVIREGTGIA
jgi:hypothetical protein